MRLKSRAVIGSHAILRGVLHNFHSSLQHLFLVPSGAKARCPQWFPGPPGKTDERYLLPDITSRITYRSSTPVLLRHNTRNFYTFTPGGPTSVYQRPAVDCTELDESGPRSADMRMLFSGGGVDCLSPRSPGPQSTTYQRRQAPACQPASPQSAYQLIGRVLLSE